MDDGEAIPYELKKCKIQVAQSFLYCRSSGLLDYLFIHQRNRMIAWEKIREGKCLNLNPKP
jgi:hypothetical protein